ncbi:hypothetical protein Aperf_G00000031350 [Anoplocephala perfoliata]
MQDRNAKTGDMTSQGFSKKLTRANHSLSSRKDLLWNDAATRSGLNCGAIFSAIKKMLCCTICFEYYTEMNQCKNGHLICRHCTRQLQHSSLSEANRGTCPTCRVALFPGISRCLLATQLSAELPATCAYCNLWFRQSDLEHHESDFCQLRPVRCKYYVFGCLWKGKASEVLSHERGCSVSRKSVKEVEKVIQENLKQLSKWSSDSSNSWQEIVSLSDEQPHGVFMCVREAILYQVDADTNQRDEFRFRGITSQFSQNEQFNVTIELNLSLDELKFHYHTRFHSGFKDKMRFRLLSINSDKLVIPTADRFRLPKLGIPHEWQKFCCKVNVCSDKFMSLASKFSDLAIDGGSNFSVKLKFVVIFESICAVRMPNDDLEERDAVIPGSPTNSQINEDTEESNTRSESIRITINQAYVTDNEVEIMPPPSVLNNGLDLSEHSWNSINDDMDMPSEVVDDFRVFADDVAEPIDPEENPLILTIRNNNALEESDTEIFNTRNIIYSKRLTPSVDDEINISTRSLRSGLRVTARKRERPKGTKKSCSYHSKGMGSLLDMLIPYLTRGHLWQNYELMDKSGSRVLGRRRTMRRKAKSRGSFLMVSQLKSCVTPFLKPFTESWSMVKRANSGLMEMGHDILKSLSPFLKDNNALMLEHAPIEEPGESSVNMIEQPYIKDNKLSLSGCDIPDTLK